MQNSTFFRVIFFFYKMFNNLSTGLAIIEILPFVTIGLSINFGYFERHL